MNFIKTILSIFIKYAEKLPLATIKIPLKLVHLKPLFFPCVKNIPAEWGCVLLIYINSLTH